MILTFTMTVPTTLDTLGAVITQYRALQATYGLETPPNPIQPLVDRTTNEITKCTVRFTKSGVANNQLQAVHNTWLNVVAGYTGAVSGETIISY